GNCIPTSGTPTKCASDADCPSTQYCALNGACTPRAAVGDLCDEASGVQCLVSGCRVCASGYCADGFCCNTACDGPCDVCAVSLGASAKGPCSLVPARAAGAPSCTPYLCSGASSLCGGGCLSDADCAGDAHCRNDGTCQLDSGAGTPCVSPSECI